MAVDIEALVAAGLYDPQAPGATERLLLLQHLLDGGASLEEITESDRFGNLSSLLLDRTMRDGELSARELAASAGIDLAQLLEDYRLLGIPIDDPDAPRFDPDEVRLPEIAALGRTVLPGAMTEEILRSIGAAMSVIAETAVAAFVGSAEDELEHRSPKDRAIMTEATGGLGLELGTHLGPILRHHLWQTTQRQRAAMANTPSRLQSTLTVGFVDLVGFTSATGRLTSPELLAFMSDFQRRTFDVVTRAGGRVIKHIGDEIMFSAIDAVSACEIALALVDEFDDAGALPRGGLAHGPVLARHGDLYGPTVNLAARLADIAISGEVLAEAGLADAAGHGPLTFDPAGRRQLKGFPEPVATVSIGRAGADR